MQGATIFHHQSQIRILTFHTWACAGAVGATQLLSKYVQNLKDEIGDVYTMLKLMVEHDVVSWDELEKRNDHKREKLKRWSDLIE